MLVTNQTVQDYYFGPLHLPGGVGQQLTVDDTSETSLYLLDDAVADAINNLYNAGKITVTSAASPFPRPTGVPQVLHGDGQPEGLVYGAQGSVYLRRDGTGANNLYVKTTGVTINTGWQAVVSGASTSAFVLLYDSGYLAASAASLDSGAAGFSTAFNHLRALVVARCDASAYGEDLELTLNDNNGASQYTWQHVSAGTGSTGNTLVHVQSVPGTSEAAGVACVFAVEIPFYAGPTFYKAGSVIQSGGDLTYISVADHVGFMYKSTSAISRIKVAPATGNFIAGSRLMVYGYN